MRILTLLLCLLPLACAPGVPALEQSLSNEARTAPYPSLVPLGPLLAGTEAPLERSAAVEGENLEARVADLRRRAERLRNMPL